MYIDLCTANTDHGLCSCLCSGVIVASFLSGPLRLRSHEGMCNVPLCALFSHVMCSFGSCVFCGLQIDNYKQRLTPGSQRHRERGRAERKQGERWMRTAACKAVRGSQGGEEGRVRKGGKLEVKGQDKREK